MALFTSQQQVVAKHLYSILMHLDPEQRRGAVLALSSLTVFVEDGYQSSSLEKSSDLDFYGFCYDALLGASIGLRMLDLSGNMPEFEGDEKLYFVPYADILDSEQLLTKIEAQLKSLSTIAQGVDKKQ